MEKQLQHLPTPLEGLFFDELREVYGAEQQQLLVLPLLKRVAASLKLRNVIASHLDDTRIQIDRLEAAFHPLGLLPEARTSETLLGITREIEQVIASTGVNTATRDAGLVVA